MEEFGYPSLAINSYTRCLEAIIRGAPIPWAVPGGAATGQPFVPGAPANARFPEWHRLYRTLLASLGDVKTGHAGEKKGQKGDAIQLSEFIHSGAKLLHSDASRWEVLGYLDNAESGYVLGGQTNVVEGGTFGWAQTFSGPLGNGNASSRFEEALAEHYGSGSGRDYPAAAWQPSERRGMQVLIADVLGEGVVG